MRLIFTCVYIYIYIYRLHSTALAISDPVRRQWRHSRSTPRIPSIWKFECIVPTKPSSPPFRVTSTRPHRNSNTLDFNTIMGAPCYAILCHAMPCHAMLCHAMPCHAMPCHAMSCYAMLCHAMPCYAMLCHAMQCNAGTLNEKR